MKGKTMKKNHSDRYGFKKAIGLACFAVLGEVEKINTLGTTILLR